METMVLALSLFCVLVCSAVLGVLQGADYACGMLPGGALEDSCGSTYSMWASWGCLLIAGLYLLMTHPSLSQSLYMFRGMGSGGMGGYQSF